MLEVAGLRAWYGRTEAVFDATFTVAAGETVALTGLNGAGKTTTVNALAGLVAMSGSVKLDGVEIGGENGLCRGRRGVVLLPETRRLFWGMTVRENLTVAAGPTRVVDWPLVFELFPALEARMAIRVNKLSGGQQQMVALARTLVSEPRVLLLDEPGHGLAPAVINDVYTALEKFKREDRGIVLVDQSLERAAKFADRLILVRNGRVVLEVDTSDPEGVREFRSRAMEA